MDDEEIAILHDELTYPAFEDELTLFERWALEDLLDGLRG